MTRETRTRTPRRHVLVQATIPPLDEDGILAFGVGTAVFAVLTVLAVVERPALAAQGRGWWLWVAVSGLVIGLVAVAYCLWRRRPSRA